MLDAFAQLILEIGGQSIANIHDYKGFDVPMPFICKKHGLQKLSINQLRQGRICPECGREKRSVTKRMTISEINQIIISKNNNVWLNSNEYIDKYTRNLKIQCGSCGNVFTTNLNSYRNSSGYCQYCAVKVVSNNSRLTISEVINIATKNGICYIVNPNDYQNVYAKNLKFKCKVCGDIFITNLANYRCGYGVCNKCSQSVSRGEYQIMSVLDKYMIRYEKEKRFDDCRDKRPLPFDFYLPTFNMCIEYDGEQHYRKMNTFDTDDSFRIRKLHDNMKTDYCTEHNLKLIRIPYWDFNNIEAILCGELNLKMKCD